LQGILTGCAETNSPVILQISGSTRKCISAPILPHLVMGGIALVRSMGSNIPIVLHLDHGSSFELAKDCIDSGFSSVMIDYGVRAVIFLIGPNVWMSRVAHAFLMPKRVDIF